MQIQTLQKINGDVCDISLDPNCRVASFVEQSYTLKNLKKQFSKVEVLHIGENVKRLELSNFLFPNVKRIVSQSSYFLSSEQGILCHRYYHSLINTFCKKEDEILDFAGVKWICPGAMQGCRTTHIENLYDSVLMNSRYDDSEKEWEKEWNGSAFLLRQSYQEALKKNGFLKCGPIIIALDKHASEIKLTGPIADISRDTLHCRYPKITIQDINSIDEDSLYQIFNIPTETLELEGLTFQRYMEMPNGVQSKMRENTRNLQASGNTDMYSYDGILYAIGYHGRSTAVACPKERGGTVIVKDGTTDILSNAFTNCKYLEQLVLPDSMEGIGAAFCGCERLVKISFGNGIQRIGTCAFDFCESLEQIEVPKQVHAIHDRAFRGCKRLKKVVLHGIPEIQRLNFQYLEELYLPENPYSLIHLQKMLKNIGERSAEEKGVSPFIKIKIGQQPWLYMPIEITKLGQDKMINLVLARYGKTYVDTIPETLSFQLSKNCRAKQETAYAIYKDTKDTNAAAYLKKVGKKMFLRKLEEGVPEPDLIAFLQEGFLSKAACTSLLPVVQQKQLPVVTAYLMKTQEKQKKQSFVL